MKWHSMTIYFVFGKKKYECGYLQLKQIHLKLIYLYTFCFVVCCPALINIEIFSTNIWFKKKSF